MANYFAPEEETVNALPARINPNLAAQGRNAVARQSTPNYDSVLEYLGLGQPDTIQQALEHLGLSDKPARMNPNLAAQGRRMNLPARQAPGPLSEFARQAVSLDPQPDQGYGTMAAEMALGFVPGVGQAMAARDIERARRDNDPVGMGMAASSFVPFGKLIGGLRKPMSELITYHGSPHRFPPTANNPLGEFDASKIGTGEGAQAYGHGLYLAENPQVASGYKEAGKGMGWEIDGVMHSGMTTRTNANPYNYAANALDRFKGDREAAIKWLDPNRHFEGAARDIIRNAKSVKPIEGSLYKVDLPDEQIAKMLDWDKPLSQQSAEVQKALKDIIDSEELFKGKYANRFGILNKENFGEHMEALANAVGGQDRLSSQLKSLGVPGIRYLDQGSRAGGEGTSNFVVFDPKHMNIIGRE